MSNRTQGGYGAGGYGVGGYGQGGAPFLEPVSYYLSLITSEYQSSPKALAWLAALLQPLNDIANCLYLFNWVLDISNAIGAQLDILGQIVGVNRTVNFQPTGGASPVLDDATYRVLLLATIARNQWDGTIDGLYNTWLLLFPGGSIQIIDNQDMSFNVVLSGSFTQIIQDLINHDLIVPRPEGVKINYGFAGLPVFGFDRHDSYVSGFDQGKWS
jgi:hypothetical protein